MVRPSCLRELWRCGVGRGVAPELQRIPTETETRELQSRRGNAAGIQSGPGAGLTKQPLNAEGKCRSAKRWRSDSKQCNDKEDDRTQSDFPKDVSQQ